MATIVFPLLLVLGAIGGVLVIIGRRLPEIRGAFKGEGKPLQDVPTRELSLAPRSATLLKPGATLLSRSLTGVRDRGRSVLRGIGRPLTRTLHVIGRVGTAFLHLFTRPPTAERIPRPGTRNGSLEVTAGAVAPKSPVPTTTDVKRSAMHPLRMPEPFTEAAGDDIVSMEKPTLAVPQPEEVSPPSATNASAPRATDDRGDEQESITTATETAVPSPPEESAVVVETTREVRTPRHRRVVGRVRPRRTRQTTAASRAPVPSAEVVEQPQGRPAAWVSTSQTIPALIEEGQFGHAESLLIDILSKNPRDTEAYRLLGMIYLKRQEYVQAREVFEEALRRTPEHRGIHGLLGDAHFSLGEYGKALSMYQRAHDAEETNVEYLEKLLTIFSRMDRRPMVLVTAKKILALNPDHEEAKKVLARASVQ